MTQDFKFPGSLGNFIRFAEGDPYYLDFGEGGQEGTISWSMEQVKYKAIDGGFRIWYDPERQAEIRSQIELTVQNYHRNRMGAAQPQE